MSTTSVRPASSSATSLDPLIKQLVDRVDANKDGQISTSEFGDFLTSILKASTAASSSSSSGSTGTTGVPTKANDVVLGLLSGVNPNPTDPSDPTEGDEFHPSTWTDNNCPYGITLAGFSPQDHTDLTLDDLGKPGKAEKYAVYHYLISNKVQPTHDWAPDAAAALNKKYNTTVYKAIDGETLGYGNEYVHSAPNGYGMLPGTYNTKATGEFFWGWT